MGEGLLGQPNQKLNPKEAIAHDAHIRRAGQLNEIAGERAKEGLQQTLVGADNASPYYKKVKDNTEIGPIRGSKMSDEKRREILAKIAALQRGDKFI